MFSKRRIIYYVALLLSILFVSHTALADGLVRIELHDGTVYDNVDMKVDNNYKVITILSGEQSKTVSFSAVAAIYDRDGVNIAGDVLGKYYRPEKPAEGVIDPPQNPRWVTSESEVEPATGFSRKSTKPFDVRIRINPSYSFPTGSWYEGFKSGPGYGVDIGVAVSREVAIRLTVAKVHSDLDLGQLSPGVQLLGDDLEIGMWRYFVSAEWYRWPKWRTTGTVCYNLYSGLGVVSHKMSGARVYYDPANDEIFGIVGTDKAEDNFALTNGGSLTVMVSKSVGIDFGLGVDFVYAKNTNGTSSIHGFLLNFGIGVATVF